MKKSILAFDYYFQLIAVIFVACISFTFFGLMFLVPLGAYQVLSAGLKGIFLNSYRHRVFALIAGLYGGTIMYIAIEGDDSIVNDLLNFLPDGAATVLGVLAYIIIPFTSAIYYLRQSSRDYKVVKEKVVAEYV